MPSNMRGWWPPLELDEARPISVMLLLTHNDQRNLPLRMLPVDLSTHDVRGAPCHVALVGPPFYAPRE